jgi:hypothetical protein
MTIQLSEARSGEARLATFLQTQPGGIASFVPLEYKNFAELGFFISLSPGCCSLKKRTTFLS